MKNEIYPPRGGWKERTWYLIEVAYNNCNPIHLALFYTGFLNGPNGTPGGYSGVHALNYADDDEVTPINKIRYAKALKKLVSEDEAEKKFRSKYITPNEMEKS